MTLRHQMTPDADGRRLTAAEWWDDTWAAIDEPWVFSPETVWVHHVLARRLRALLPPLPATCLEIGCGGSSYLPWIGAALGLSIHGLDYSPKGLALCERAIRRAGVTGELIPGDLFDDTVLRGRRFDSIVSFGFVEHFEDTAAVIEQMKRALKPGGVLLCTVPNLRSLNGWIMRTLDREVWERHVVLGPGELATAFTAAGLDRITFAGYFGTVCLNAVIGKRAVRSLSPLWQKGVLRLTSCVDRLVSKLLFRLGRDVEFAWTSPHVIVCGRSGS